jgi:magnesium transporter
MNHAAPVIRTRVWRHGVLEAEDFTFAKISEYLKQEDCLVWVDVCNPKSHELHEIAEELTLDPLAVEDAIGHEERSKATRYDTHMFLTAYAVSAAGDKKPGALPSSDISHAGLRFSRVSAFVLERGIVTVRTGSDFDIEEVVRRWDENSGLLKYGTGALVHGLLDTIVDGHFEAVQLLDDRIEAVEDRLFEDDALSKRLQQRTYRVRKDLVELRRVVLPMREVVNAVLRHRQEFDAPAELNSWYDDLYDHVLRASEWTESLRDMVTTVFETNLSLQDSRLNMVMKQLTAWAAIIAVPTAVTGWFGQNIPYPGFGQIWGFYESVIIIVGIAVALFVTFKRKDWL